MTKDSKFLTVFTLLLAILAGNYVYADISTILGPRNPGDSIFNQCQDIPVGITTIRNVCVNLNEGVDCGLNVSLSVGSTKVFSKNLEMGIVPRACGSYRQGSLPCELCVSLDPDPKTSGQMCLNIIPKCGGFEVAKISAGCFSSSRLDSIRQCQSRLCPNRCSGHGECNDGVCTCSPGYYTKDCSSTTPTWEACRQVQQVGGNVCARVQFKDCQVKTQLLVIPAGGGDFSLPIYDKSYPVTSFKYAFQDRCASSLGCDVCMKWKDLVLNATDASGCGAIDFSCFGIKYQEQTLGCFDDKTVATCLGSCPNDCSGYGECTRGLCKCVKGWTGDDCSEKEGTCPNGCSSHGQCLSTGSCKCSGDWGGKDCSLYIGGEGSSQTETAGKGGKKNTAAMVLIPIVVIGLFGVMAVLIWFFVKKRFTDRSHAFNQLDLLEEDDTSGAQELDEDVSK